MSTMSSLLPFLLLCLTMHACEARFLGAITKGSPKQVQFCAKEVDKERLAKTSTVSQVMIPKSSELLAVQIQASKRESFISVREGCRPIDQKSKDTRVRHRKVKKKKKKGKVIANSQESLVSVSWHISHDKHKRNPGFNLDYAPPKTHPPSHN